MRFAVINLDTDNTDFEANTRGECEEFVSEQDDPDNYIIEDSLLDPEDEEEEDEEDDDYEDQNHYDSMNSYPLDHHDHDDMVYDGDLLYDDDRGD